ncbi:hypothetical protein C8Q80DRAFT_750473 [Daedaleopsis nitida]|nr:hypothetical protein C8Q80DRAFT_750473 [Daedaleopsis nitida]
MPEPRGILPRLTMCAAYLHGRRASWSPEVAWNSTSLVDDTDSYSIAHVNSEPPRRHPGPPACCAPTRARPVRDTMRRVASCLATVFDFLGGSPLCRKVSENFQLRQAKLAGMGRREVCSVLERSRNVPRDSMRWETDRGMGPLTALSALMCTSHLMGPVDRARDPSSLALENRVVPDSSRPTPSSFALSGRTFGPLQSPSSQARTLRDGSSFAAFPAPTRGNVSWT